MNSAPDLQPRDLLILSGLLDLRLMTRSHIAALYFNARTEAAKKRLQKLRRVGLVNERRRRVYEPSVLTLSKRGFQALRDTGRLAHLPMLTWAEVKQSARVSEAILRHRLALIDFKAALSRALVRQDQFHLTDFAISPQFPRARQPVTERSPTIKPDAFIRIRDRMRRQNQAFFLEIDRSRETLTQLATRIESYRDYYRRGGFARAHGERMQDYAQFPFRVLVLFRTPHRRNHAAEHLLLLKKPVLRQVWLGILDEVVSDPLGTVWITPLAYRNATASTPFAPSRSQMRAKDRSSIDRDEFVEQSVIKQGFLDT